MARGQCCGNCRRPSAVQHSPLVISLVTTLSKPQPFPVNLFYMEIPSLSTNPALKQPLCSVGTEQHYLKHTHKFWFYWIPLSLCLQPCVIFYIVFYLLLQKLGQTWYSHLCQHMLHFLAKCRVQCRNFRPAGTFLLFSCINWSCRGPKPGCLRGMTASLPTQCLALNFESIAKILKKRESVQDSCSPWRGVGFLSGNGRDGHWARREGKLGTEQGSEVGWVEEVRTPGWPGCPKHSLSKASRDTLVTVTRLSWEHRWPNKPMEKHRVKQEWLCWTCLKADPETLRAITLARPTKNSYLPTWKSIFQNMSFIFDSDRWKGKRGLITALLVSSELE